MTYTQHPVTPALLARLWVNLWERGRTEAELCGLSLQQLFDLFLSNAAQGAGGILCADGEPILCAGLCTDGREVTTFMAATDDFDRHWRQIVRTIRAFVRERDGPIYIYSVTVHPKSARFFGALGFEPDLPWLGQTRTGAPLYRFKRKQPCALAAAAALPTP